MAAYAVLDNYISAKSITYRIRLNHTVRDAMQGVQYVKVMKSSDYIVLRPVGETDDYKCKVVRYKTQTFITANGLVADGFLPRHWFGTKKRLKVKKTRTGDIYICLGEEVKPIGNC